MNIQEILKDENVNIIDVREPYEFERGHVQGAMNMPLSQFGDYVEKIRAMEGPKVLYCASGNRSGQATAYLRSIGLDDVYNGGAFMIMEAMVA